MYLKHFSVQDILCLFVKSKSFSVFVRSCSKGYRAINYSNRRQMILLASKDQEHLFYYQAIDYFLFFAHINMFVFEE